jgi:integrase
MPQSKKASSGMGSIRKITREVNGKTYSYYEARYTAGFDPGTGKQIQRSITGKTQKEVSQKLKAALAALDSGTYIAPCKMTVAEWLDVWASQYLGGVKESTVAAYNATIRTHIKPGLGAIRLDALDTHLVQSFYNGLREPTKDRAAASPKTVKNVHGILHKALQQAVANGYIRFNPTNSCILPRIEKKELQPLDEAETKLFLDAVKGHPLELLYTITLFTGLREGEALGLTWDHVDFIRGTILISKQLQKEKKAGGQFRLVSLKNDKPRRIQPAPWVMQLLRDRKLQQYEHKEKAGAAWSNPLNLVFTNELGGNLIPQTVVRHFKEIVTAIGRPDARFHDLRHSYAVASLRSGDDIKTVQGNLGHATAAFTLDVYGHVTNQMQEASAIRMEAYIKGILEL